MSVKISELPRTNSLNPEDLLVVVNNLNSTPQTKSLSAGYVLNIIPSDVYDFGIGSDSIQPTKGNNNSFGIYSVILGGTDNTNLGNYSGVLGGQNNNVNHDNSFVIGSNITTDDNDTTYVNKLKSQGIIYALSGDSNQWNLVTTAYQNISSNWQNIYTNVTKNSSIYAAVSAVNGTIFQINSVNTDGVVQLSFPTSIVMPGDVNINGTLFVQGSSYVVNTQSFSVNDPLIYIGEGNLGNLYDLGFIGAFDDGLYQHTGFVRNHLANKWTLFSGMTSEPLSAIITTDPTFKIDTLQANIEGTLVGNVSGNVTGDITGNATTVTNGVYTTGSYSDPSWIVEIADSKITGNKFIPYTDGDTRYSKLSSTAYTLVNTTNSIAPVLGTNTSSGVYASIVGGRTNTASGACSFVGGGLSNRATGLIATVAGGQSNCATATQATVGGGSGNCGTGISSTVAGGRANTASGYIATVAGGRGNTASGLYTFVGGGWCNRATVSYSVIGGGFNNIASSRLTFVAGGSGNNTGTFENTFILGSNITASQSNYTYVNNLSASANIHGNFYGDGSNLTGISGGGSTSVNTWVQNNSAIATFITSVSAPSISAVAFYGDGSNLTGISGGGNTSVNTWVQNNSAVAVFTTSLSAPSISSVNYFGNGNQVILSDGYTVNNIGNGSNTLSMNFANGVYVGLSGANPIYALGVPRYITLQSTASSISTGMSYFYNAFPVSDYLVSGSQYEIEYVLYYQVNDATTVTYSLSANNQLALVSSNYSQTAAAGISPNAAATTAAGLITFNNVLNLPATTTLTSGTSASAIIKTYVNTSASPVNFVLNVNLSTGSITPLQGSYRKIIRIS